MYKGSALEATVKKLMGSQYPQIKKLFYLNPYDWGCIITSQGEVIDPQKHCTCLMMAHMGKNKYQYIVIYAKSSRKKSKVIPAKGKAKFVMEEYENYSPTFHKIYLEEAAL